LLTPAVQSKAPSEIHHDGIRLANTLKSVMFAMLVSFQLVVFVMVVAFSWLEFSVATAS